MDFTTPTANPRKTIRYTQDLARPRAYQVAATAEQIERPTDDRVEEAGSAAWRPAVVQQRLSRIWRVSLFILFLVLLATIVHIVQFFVPSGITNQLYANIVQGNRASVRQAPEGMGPPSDDQTYG